MAYKKLAMRMLLVILLMASGSNLGKVVDISQQPVRSDIIVSLGGGKGDRIIKALELYNAGYSKTDKFIYTSLDTVSIHKGGVFFSKRGYLEKNGVQKEDIIHIERSTTTNTMEEVLFIKEFMLEHKLESVLFVSDPWHTGRISAFADIIAGYNEAGLRYKVVGTHLNWWDRTYYYRSISAVKVTIKEIGKLAYNLLKYGTPLIRYTKYCKKKRSGDWEKAINRFHPEERKVDSDS